MMSNTSFSNELTLKIFGSQFRIQTNSNLVFDSLISIFQAFQTNLNGNLETLEYTIEYIKKSNQAFHLYDSYGRELSATNDFGYLLYAAEKEITIELQKIRTDLFFIHAATLDLSGKVLLLIAPSGTGKSTTAWGLVHSGFTYLSDELAPINLDRMEVVGFPRALCLKSKPPEFTSLPKHLEIENRIHIPVKNLPSPYSLGPTKISAIFILTDRVTETSNFESQTLIMRAGNGEAVQHIYANSLNALAHNDKGLEAAIEIAASSPCYFLKSRQSLRSTCDAIYSTLSA